MARVYTDPFGTHQEFLEFYIKQTAGEIIEFGTGNNSTGLIRDCIQNTNRKLISVESNIEWLNKMKSEYPENENHSYIFVNENDWEDYINNIEKTDYSVVFIDQAPWIARKWTLDKFKNDAEYVIIHDVDYFPVNNIFGKVISEFEFDFSDISNNYKVYYPAKPYPYKTGPPTLVFSNIGKTIYEL